MNREEALEYFKNKTVVLTEEEALANAMAIKALEQEPTTKNNLGVDCISRADAIQIMQDKAKKLTNEDTINGLCGAVAILFELPSVTPQEPKTGHWYRQTNDFVDYYECSECGMAIGLYDVKNYCPNCGSRNEVEE